MLMYSSYSLDAYAAKAPVKPNDYFCVGYGIKGYSLLPKPAIRLISGLEQASTHGLIVLCLFKPHGLLYDV